MNVVAKASIESHLGDFSPTHSFPTTTTTTIFNQHHIYLNFAGSFANNFLSFERARGRICESFTKVLHLAQTSCSLRVQLHYYLVALDWLTSTDPLYAFTLPLQHLLSTASVSSGARSALQLGILPFTDISFSTNLPSLSSDFIYLTSLRHLLFDFIFKSRVSPCSTLPHIGISSSTYSHLFRVYQRHMEKSWIDHVTVVPEDQEITLEMSSEMRPASV